MHQIVKHKDFAIPPKGITGIILFLQPNDGVLCPQQHLVELYIEKSS